MSIEYYQIQLSHQSIFIINLRQIIFFCLALGMSNKKLKLIFYHIDQCVSCEMEIILNQEQKYLFKNKTNALLIRYII